MYANKGTSHVGDTMQGTKESTTTGRQCGLDKEKMLKVTWKKNGGDYTGEQLRDLFKKFGVVVNVHIEISEKKKKKGLALVEMASKEAIVGITTQGGVLRDLPNLLFVMPLQSTARHKNNIIKQDEESIGVSETVELVCEDPKMHNSLLDLKESMGFLKFLVILNCNSETDKLHYSIGINLIVHSEMH
ncbi:hypothetical protein LIER_03177 [Lithospermum erythrorhizon]|uniref:RRM domain-containing protein n=1 Tax=Lithospermum erythrorhizon TaxID=34254 RepID=A0AAV3NS70_LITER